MKLALNQNELATLSTILLSNLDVDLFFAKLTSFIQEHLEEESVLGFEVLLDGSTRLRAENGKALDIEKILTKGQGLSGYVARTKRAYYSNAVKRDPLACTGIKNEKIESELCVPVMTEGAIIGTINIQTSNKEKHFSDADITQINDLLIQLKAPIKNIHLYLMAQNLNKELLSKIQSTEKDQRKIEKVLNKKIEDDSVQIIGHSKNFLEIIQMSKKIAPQDFPILLEGAHGVGKKLLAKKIHQWSGRKGQCVIASCSSMNEVQLDKEIFGSKGLLVQANGGTLIIDDISSSSLNMQSKILRALISGEMITIDNEQKIPLNVRFIVINKSSLKELTEAGKFKEELFYRLNTISFRIPSLKERRDDIKVLAEYFLNQGKQNSKILTSGAIEKLSQYFWPGNAHELKNIMERTYILTDGQYIESNNLPDFSQEIIEEIIETPIKFIEATLFDLEKKHIIDTLDYLSGNKTRAAKALGITVKTLYNKLHSYGLIDIRES